MKPANLTNAFLILKQTMKRRGMTYGSLAEALGTSEGAVKNIFMRSSCQIEKLAAIAECLQVSLGDLFKTAEAHSSEILVLTELQEQYFADHPDVFLFFRACFYDELSPRAVKRKWHLSDQKLESYLKCLEHLELAERHPNQTLRFLVRGNLQWRPRGPWMKKHLQEIGNLACERVLTHPGSFHSLGYLTLTQEQIATFHGDLDAVIRKYRDLGARDYLVRDRLPQLPISWNFTMVPGDICVEAVS